MSIEKSYFEQLNLSKRIPLHYQKRYLANISNGSFNATFISGIYKNKIKALLKNNKMLALALQSDKAKREELLEESKANANLIMFSRLNLASMSENLKKVVSALDDTLAMLESHSTSGLLKCTPRNTVGREEFKEQVKNVILDAIPEESKHSLSNESNEDLSVPTSQMNGTFANVISQPEKNITEVPKNSKNKENKNSKPKSLKKETVSNELNSSVFKVKQTSSRINEKKAMNKVNNLKSAPSKIQAVTKIQKSNKEMINDKTSKETKQFSAVLKEKELDEVKDNDFATTTCIILGKHSMKNLKSSENFLNADPHMNKENVYSKIPGLTEASTELFPELDTILTGGKKSNIKGSALKSLSSKMNIENLSLESKKLQNSFGSLDDLTRKDVTSHINRPKHKTKKKLLQNPIKKKSLFASKKKKVEDVLSKINTKEEISRNHFQNTLLSNSFQPQEIVKNLAKNTVLTTAEIHNGGKNSLKSIPQNFDKCYQPIVLVQDIFKVNKSFCKSISDSCQSQPNIPLELQLLQHCSSLKIIPEESETSNNSNVDVTNASNYGESNLRQNFMEPTLSVEGEIIDNVLNSEKRVFRKRPAITYKERALNLKLRK